MKFVKGDRIIKTRAYDDKLYCRHGGSKQQVPIGTKGTIRAIKILLETNEEALIVDYDNSVNAWYTDPIEVDIIAKKNSLKSILEETKNGI